MRTRVYVSQFGATWSLSRKCWMVACRMAVDGDEFNWDDLGRRLSRPAAPWTAQKKPLDWDEEDWANELAEAKLALGFPVAECLPS